MNKEFLNKKIWLTTDTHFNHDNIITYCNRPKEHEQIIYNNMIKYIDDNDILIHLGDICIGKDKLMHEKYIIPLKFKKILVRGNHDNKSINWYLENGWDFVVDNFVIRYMHKKILFSHEPIIEHEYDLNIHGHEHDKGAYKLSKKHLLLSIELKNYKPTLLNDLINK